MRPCSTCGADVLWATTAKAKAMPVDPEPVPEGNVQLCHGSDGLKAWVLAGNRLDAARQAGARLHLSHFVTCEFAAQHRKKKS